MNAGLTWLGAFALGLMASGHCLVMCGGISGALALATRTNARGRVRLDLLMGYQVGRIGSYMLAAMLLSGAGAVIVQFVDAERVRLMLRWLSAGMIAAIGISLLLRGRGFDLQLGRGVWKHLAPLTRRLIPVRNLAQALALGAAWGWMPCGLAYSVLIIAWLSMDPWRAAAIMLAFGLGTVPAVLAGAYGASSGLRLLAHRGLRSAVASLLIAFAGLTAAGPWLAAHGVAMTRWLPFACGIH